MASISLTTADWLWYSGGKSGVSAVVGNDWDTANSAVIRRVGRISFTAPSTGATGVSLTFHTARGDGAFVPLRFFIGTDPDSHVNAGPNAQYTGELTLGSDYLTHTGQADILLVPNQTYYLWIFPDSDDYGWYYGYRTNYTSVLTTSGAAMSGITAEDGTLGTEHTIALTRYGSDMTHALTAVCGSESLEIASGVKTDTVTWTPPMEWAAQNTTGTAVAVTITCTTYSGNTAIGSTSLALTFGIPAEVTPTASIAASDTKGHLTTYGSYVQNKSQVQVDVTAAGIYGSTIKSCVITCGSQSASGTSATFSLPTSGSIAIKAVATDSRGRTAAVSVTITVSAYSPPTVQITSAYRCDEDGNEDDEGAYGIVVFNANITGLGGKNEAAYSLKYRVRGASSWSSISISALDGSYAPVGAAQVFPASAQSGFDVCIVAKDDFGSIESTYRVVPASFALWQVKRSIASIAFGMLATMANTISFGLKVMFHKGIKLTVVRIDSFDDIDAALDAAVANLEDHTMDFQLFQVGGSFWHCILFKTNSQYATAELYSYAGRRRKVLFDSAWKDLETIR